MFHGHHHKHNHGKHYESWDTPNGYQVYATVREPMPNKLPEAQSYPSSNGTFNDNYEGYVVVDPRMIDAMEYERQDYVVKDPRRIGVLEYERAPGPFKANDHKVKESVDAEAEAFIVLEHKKFQTSKTIASFN